MTNEKKAKDIVLSKPFNNASSQDYAYKCAMEMAEWKEQQMINRALKHLQDVYTQFDITDTNGYRIDFRFFKYEFEKAMKGE